MAENSSYKAMAAIVERTENGKILIPDDFTLCGTPDSVRSGLTRLCKNGKLNRFAKGIYYIPVGVAFYLCRSWSRQGLC